MRLALNIFRFSIILLLLLKASATKAQEVTNAGRDFWMGFTEVADKATADYWLNVSSRDTTSVTVTIPGTGFSLNQTIVPGSVTRFTLPRNDASIAGSDTIINRAVHVVSDSDVVVYAVTYHQFRHEASLVLPTPALGSRYRAITQKSEFAFLFKGGVATDPLRESEFIIVTGVDSVAVEITPSNDAKGGKPEGIPFQVTVPPESIYALQADSVQDDLNGTLIEGIDSEKPFAVFSGNEWSTVVCTPTLDPLYEQMFPTNTWGKEYIVLPTPTVTKDFVRIMADQDSTLLLRNDTLVDTLMAGEWFEDTLNAPTLYRGSKRISAGFFMVTRGTSCAGNLNTDPSMIILNSNEQMFLDSITFFATDPGLTMKHYIHIITRTGDTAAIFLDGVLQTGFTVLTHDTAYSFKSLEVAVGSHTLETTGCGFNAYALGMASAVSYAYAAGVQLNNLNNTVDFENVSTGSDTICITDSVRFNPGILGTPNSFQWSFSDGTQYGIQNPVKKFDTSGVFFYSLITEYQCFNDTLFDTIFITTTPHVDLGPDTLLCSGPPLILDSENPGMLRFWSTGDTSQTLTLDSGGTFAVVVSNLVCFDRDTITVEIPQIGADFNYLKSNQDRPDICTEEGILFFNSFLGTPIDYEWDFGDGSTLADAPQVSHDYGSGGSFIVRLLPRFQCGLDTLTLEVSDTLLIIDYPDVELDEDTFLCLPDTVRLKIRNAQRVFWEPGGETADSIKVFESGLIGVYAENASCATSDSIYVDIPILADVIPNVFTPNGDGINDFFELGNLDRCENYVLQVFNRWGVEVYQSDQVPGERWDGRSFSGKALSTGVYFYRLEGDGVDFKGAVTLIR